MECVYTEPAPITGKTGTGQIHGTHLLMTTRQIGTRKGANRTRGRTIPQQQQQDPQSELQNAQLTQTQKLLYCIPRHVIFANPDKFGFVQHHKDTRYTHVYLYRHDLALTPDEAAYMQRFTRLGYKVSYCRRAKNENVSTPTPHMPA